MFLKKNSVFLSLIIIFISSSVYSKEMEIYNLIDYLKNIKNYSVSFVQKDGESISEGNISIGNKRLRVDYFSPSNIIIILDENKGMYFNKDLEEDEFFNPKDTSAWVFFEIFKNPEFIKNAKIVSSENTITAIKSGESENYIYKLELVFENNPLLIRKINLDLNGSKFVLSFFDHKSDEVYDKNHFKLINPTFFD